MKDFRVGRAFGVELGNFQIWGIIGDEFVDSHQFQKNRTDMLSTFSSMYEKDVCKRKSLSFIIYKARENREVIKAYYERGNARLYGIF